MKRKNTGKYLLLLFFLVVTIYSRFINLNWDHGFGLHPDENNLWGASRQVKLFTQLDPNFYAYGGFPIYVYSLLEQEVQARAISAAVQTFIVLLLFFLGRKFAGWSGGIFSAAMGTFSAGLVQAAHFLTVESLIGFFSLLLVWGLIQFVLQFRKTQSGRVKNSGILKFSSLCMAAVVLGLGVGTKVSFIVFGLPFLALLLIRLDIWESKARPFSRLTRQSLLQKTLPFIMLVFALSLALSVFLLTNPYAINQWESVRSILTYEMNIATGKLPVFYTRQFIDTTPGWFQAVHIFPFITGWLFIPMLIIGIFVLVLKVRPWRAPGSDLWTIQVRTVLITSGLSAFLSFLPFWAKWTRYVVQVLPLFIFIAGIGVSWLWRRGLLEKLFAVAALITFLPPFFSILSVYQNQDTRFAAAGWATSHIDGQAKIFTEAMDLGIIPFNSSLGKQISLFNFYDLDADKTGKEQETLQNLVNESDDMISVSERVYGNSLNRPNLFPRSASFYKSLFDGSLGYMKIYESSPTGSCSLFSVFCFLFSVPEETFSAFDHPRVMIFAKDSMK